MTVSIITINYNNQQGLARTIKSVLAQSLTQFEYLIIDGGSTDGSLELIKQHTDRLGFWVSEKDGGVYHAMNKGIAAAKNEYVIFINSGDEFIDENSLAKLVNESKGADIVYGNIRVKNDASVFIKSYPAVLNFSYFLADTLPHPASLIKRALFAYIGGYNENLKIVADWEFFMVAVCKHNATYRYVDETIALFYFDGISSISDNIGLIKKEKEAVLQKQFPLFLADYSAHASTAQSLFLVEQSRAFKWSKKITNSPLVKYLKK